MILYLYNGDSYLRTQKLRELIAQYTIKHGKPELLEADLDEDKKAWEKLGAFLEQPSMFSENKFAVVRETGEIDEKDEKKWIGILKRELETDKTFLIALDKKVPRKAFRFLTEKPVRAQEFPELSGATLSTFLKKECEARNLNLSLDAVRLFAETIEQCDEPGWNVINNLNRLRLQIKEKKQIEKKDIEKLLPTSSIGELFALVKGFMNEVDPKKALVTLERALHQADSAYVFNFAASLARGNGLLAFSEYDIAIKSGKLGYEEALADFVLGGERLSVFS